MRSDGIALTANPTDFAQGLALQAAFDVGPDGRHWANNGAWTGASSAGARSGTTPNCQDWSSSAQSVTGSYGSVAFSSTSFFSPAGNTPAACNNAAVQLYCVQP